ADWAPVAWSAITFTISAVYLVKIDFEKWMWRWKILRERLVRFPDLSGVWLARWDSIAFQSEHRSLVTIEHDFDHIVCTSTRRNAEGETISESVSISCQLQYNEQTKRIELSVVYRNNPGPFSRPAPPRQAPQRLRPPAACRRGTRCRGLVTERRLLDQQALARGR